MEHQSRYLSPEIKISSFGDRLFKSEILVDQHMLVWFVSGQTKIVQADTCYHFRSGDIFLVPRNQPATIINYPTDNLPHQTVVMQLSTSRLRDFYQGINSRPAQGDPGRIRSYNSHPLLASCFASLMPYFQLTQPLPEAIAAIKITEAISILRLIDEDIDSLLANFSLPAKTDLVDFMEKHFIFNMPMERFGYLTGRSLTSFKRDFRKAFDSSPRQWLTRKRLELAYHHIKEKKGKPVDVCYEVGFENLSHFSFAFKKHFGYAPTALLTGA
ncbi:MAG: helix-turn-helix domain-containing protein [Candidatus Pseudobacter hemicellulosilyticus]|uniref:Helix-turn-helix domain-containing protein n=1 Tax=Candidatus Pseudobacter hemicellulosilyticus TaxID=3121375 RepID=A0AAJ6BFC1_9BACT|nr:MAG: helix-turn-helix domain-containing protein [Pseudobacter sp.]